MYINKFTLIFGDKHYFLLSKYQKLQHVKPIFHHKITLNDQDLMPIIVIPVIITQKST